MRTLRRAAQPRVPFPFCGLASLACILASSACGSTGTSHLADTLPDASAPDSSPPDGAPAADAAPETSSPGDAPSDGPFHEAPHAFAAVPNGGGPILAHPTLVTITYADDPQRPFAESLGAYLVQSPWLTAVGAEYGVGLGTHVSVELKDDAPSSIDDTAIQKLVESLIVAGTAPAPSGGTVVPTWTAPPTGDAGSPGGDDGGSDAGADAEAGASTAVLIPAVYMLYVPTSTTETVDGMKLCDWSGGGYHSQSQGSFHGQTFSYAVVSQCPNSGGLVGLQQAVSHELIEACTDPSPTAPAYKITDSYSVWSALGGEVGDLCALIEPQWSEEGTPGFSACTRTRRRRAAVTPASRPSDRTTEPTWSRAPSFRSSRARPPSSRSRAGRRSRCRRGSSTPLPT